MRSEQTRAILISDTDAAGVVFFGRYPILFHDAYEMAFLERGVPLMQRTKEDGIVLPVTNLNVEYRRPLVAGDQIMIRLHTEISGNDTVNVLASIWKQTDKGERETTRYRAEHTCVSLETGRRAPFPEFWRKLLETD